MHFPKRLSLNDAIYRLVIDREGYVPPRQIEFCAGPLLDVLDVLEDRFETLICQSPNARKDLQRDLDAIDDARKLAATVRDEILDNARYLSDGEAGIEQLLQGTHLPYLSGEKLLRWAGQPVMDIRVKGLDDFYKRMAAEAEETSGKNTETPPSEEAVKGDPPKLWQGVTLELRAANKIWVIASEFKRTRDLEGTALVSQRNKQLTEIGAQLLKVAADGAIANPKPGKNAPQALRTQVSKLRKDLKEIAGINQDPFMTFNKADGYRARFRLKDRRNAAEERARNRAQQVSYDDERDSANAVEEYSFDHEDDEAGRYLNRRLSPDDGED